MYSHKKDLRYFYTYLGIGKVLNLFRILYIIRYKDLKNAVIFLIMNVSPFFGKIEVLTYIQFVFVKKSENLPTYSDYECLQLKRTEFASNASEISAKKKTEILLKVVMGKITIGATFMLTETFVPPDSGFWVL